MAGKAPGKHHRKGITIVELTKMFPDDEAARGWLEAERWPDGPYCPHCGTFNVQPNIKHKQMTHRCRECPKRRMFTVRTGTVMRDSKLGYQKWAIAIYLFSTSLKSVSSMRLHRDLGITQKSAWFMAQRIRRAYDLNQTPFEGPVEVDEAFFGGLEKNKHSSKKLHEGRGTVGKTAVVAAKDRATGEISARVVPSTDAATLQPFVIERTERGAKVFTDDHGAYRGMPGVKHQTVKHSVGEYVDGMAHTNGVESFWASLKRGYHGTFHHVSEKHLGRYVGEFSGRHNARSMDTIDQMSALVRGMDGKRLRYTDLTA